LFSFPHGRSHHTDGIGSFNVRVINGFHVDQVAALRPLEKQRRLPDSAPPAP